MVIIQRKIKVRHIHGDKFNKQSITLLRNGRIQIREFTWNTVIVLWKSKIFAFIKNALAIYAHSQTRSTFTDTFSRRTLPVWNMIHLLLCSLILSLFWGHHQVLFSCFLVVWISFCKDLVRCQIAQVTDCMFCHHFHRSSGKLFILLLNVVRFARSIML